MELIALIVFILILGIASQRKKQIDTYSEYIRKTEQTKELKIQKDNIDYSGTTYKEYLKSSKWFDLKKQRLSIDEFTCQQCGTRIDFINSHCHHITYQRLYIENIYQDLVSVCVQCHNEIHEFYRKNAK